MKRRQSARPKTSAASWRNRYPITTRCFSKPALWAGSIIFRQKGYIMRYFAALVLLPTVASLLAQSSSTYHVTHTYTLGEDGSWDYVIPDPPHHRLFIARQTRLMVVDEDSGKLLGEVNGIQGAHGTAPVESTGHGFATSGNDQSVVMFDLKTFEVLGR